MNGTLLLTLLSRCRQLLEEYRGEEDTNETLSATTAIPLPGTSPTAAVSSSRETYDNAYFYILFVMVFYSVLALTLFKCMGSEDENGDPYEESINAGKPPPRSNMAERFYFEEEGSL